MKFKGMKSSKIELKRIYKAEKKVRLIDIF